MTVANDPTLFFLTGTPKSGTTWMMNMLNCLQGVRCSGEGRFFSSAFTDVPSLYQGIIKGIKPWHEFTSHRKKNWIGLDHEIRTINRHNFVGKDVLENELDHDTRQIMRFAVGYFMTQKVTGDGDYKWIGDKTPVLCVDEFKRMIEVFPDSKIIFLQRNVKDFIVSVLFHYWRSMRERRPDCNLSFLVAEDFFVVEEYINGGKDRGFPFVRKKTAMALAQQWKLLDDEVRRYKNVCEGPIRFFSYEDLFEHPLEVLRNVVSFLGIKSDETKLIEVVSHNTRDSVKRGTNNVLKEHVRSEKKTEWEKYLSDEIVSVINSVCGFG